MSLGSGDTQWGDAQPLSLSADTTRGPTKSHGRGILLRAGTGVRQPMAEATPPSVVCSGQVPMAEDRHLSRCPGKGPGTGHTPGGSGQ